MAPREIWLDRVGSTNEEALALAERGEQGPVWIAAGEQTGGRGRSGRSWVSPKGNLYASLLLTFPEPLPAVTQLALVAGLAAHDAVLKLAPQLPLRLKWPNDLLIDDKKLGGILIEGRIRTQQPGHQLVIGFGINLVHHPDITGRPAVSLAAFGVTTHPEKLLKELSAAFDRWYPDWAEGAGIGPIREAWLARGIPRGTCISVNTGQEHLHGRFAGLDGDGALLLALLEGPERRITFGDVDIVAG